MNPKCCHTHHARDRYEDLTSLLIGQAAEWASATDSNIAHAYSKVTCQVYFNFYHPGRGWCLPIPPEKRSPVHKQSRRGVLHTGRSDWVQRCSVLWGTCTMHQRQAHREEANLEGLIQLCLHKLSEVSPTTLWSIYKAPLRFRPFSSTATNGSWPLPSLILVWRETLSIMIFLARKG